MRSLLQNFNIIHETTSKMWTAVYPLEYLINSTFRLIKNSKKETFSYRWLISNLDKGYKVTSSKYQSFDTTHMTISKMWTESTV